MRLSTQSLLATLVFLPLAYATSTFALVKAYQKTDFYSWKWETFDDPTHGRVNYLGLDEAVKRGLAYTTPTSFVMRADAEHTVTPTERGRASIRISSYDTIDQGIVILNLLHMPEGCGTWPAFWTLSQKGPWPQGGEIDILEGVNDDAASLCSLHTSPGCTMPETRNQTGAVISSNCDATVNFNQGCGNRITAPNSFGAQFNRAGGGWFAMLKSESEGIKIWFWARNNPQVPFAVTGASPVLLNPSVDLGGSLGFGNVGLDATVWSNWGVPVAHFPPDNCDMKKFFDPHAIVFDLTFCGDWAGTAWSTSSCKTDAYPTCERFVDQNPSAFNNSYWEILGLSLYKML